MTGIAKSFCGAISGSPPQSVFHGYRCCNRNWLWCGSVGPAGIGESRPVCLRCSRLLAACSVLISAIAIIIAFGELPRFQLFRDSGQYKNASIVFFSAMRWFAVLTVAAFVVLLVDTSASQWTPAIYAIGWLALISSARLCRCMWILVKLTKIAVSPNRLNNDRHAA